MFKLPNKPNTNNNQLETYKYFQRYYTNPDLNPTIVDFLIQISTSSTYHQTHQPISTTILTEPSFITTRRSSYFPMPLSEGLGKTSTTTASAITANGFIINNSIDIILSLEEQGVLVCQWLASCLTNYSKVLEALSSSATPPQTTEPACQLRSFILQVFYLFVDVLEKLSNLDNNNNKYDTDKQTAINLIYETVAKYLNDFLLVYNQSIIKKDQTLDVFLSKNTLKIHTYTTKGLPSSFLAVSICSQLVQLVRHSKPGPVETYLAKELVTLVSQLNDKELKSDSDYMILDTLLELFIKSPSLRQCVEDECGENGFHNELIACLRSCFAHGGSGKSLEIIMDLVFVYGYFNRKVSPSKLKQFRENLILLNNLIF